MTRETVYVRFGKLETLKTEYDASAGYHISISVDYKRIERTHLSAFHAVRTVTHSGRHDIVTETFGVSTSSQIKSDIAMRILPQPDTTSDRTFHYTIIISSALTMAQVYAGANCEFPVGTMCDDAIRAALYDDMSLIQTSESADSFASMVGDDDEKRDANEMLNTMVSEDAVSDYLQQNGYGSDDAAAIDRYRNAIDVDAVLMNCGANYNQADFGGAYEKDYPFDVVIVSDVGTLNSEYGGEMLMPCDVSILLDDDIDSDLMLAVLRTMSYVIAPTSFDGSKSTYGMRNVKFLYDTKCAVYRHYVETVMRRNGGVIMPYDVGALKVIGFNADVLKASDGGKC